MLSLPELQTAFLRAVVEDGAVVPTPQTDDLLAEIEAREPLGPRARIQIYARMYRARLVAALAEDYPRVAAVLGPERFLDAAHAYLSACPSRHPSLRWFGAGFADFLATLRVQPPFLADLARLEWARLMVFDAPDVRLLSVEALRRVPPDAWGGLRLPLVPAVAVLRVEWPVHTIWNDPAVPLPDAQAAEIWLRVWRQGDRVYQASMDVPERIAFEHVRADDEFGTLCAGLATVMAEEEVPTVAGALVLRWIEDELLHDDARS
jgi:hypothetical protein